LSNLRDSKLVKRNDPKLIESLEITFSEEIISSDEFNDSDISSDDTNINSTESKSCNISTNREILCEENKELTETESDGRKKSLPLYVKYFRESKANECDGTKSDDDSDTDYKEDSDPGYDSEDLFSDEESDSDSESSSDEDEDEDEEEESASEYLPNAPSKEDTKHKSKVIAITNGENHSKKNVPDSDCYRENHSKKNVPGSGCYKKQKIVTESDTSDSNESSQIIDASEVAAEDTPPPKTTKTLFNNRNRYLSNYDGYKKCKTCQKCEKVVAASTSKRILTILTPLYAIVRSKKCSIFETVFTVRPEMITMIEGEISQEKIFKGQRPFLVDVLHKLHPILVTYKYKIVKAEIFQDYLKAILKNGEIMRLIFKEEALPTKITTTIAMPIIYHMFYSYRYKRRSYVEFCWRNEEYEGKSVDEIWRAMKLNFHLKISNFLCEKFHNYEKKNSLYECKRLKIINS